MPGINCINFTDVNLQIAIDTIFKQCCVNGLADLYVWDAKMSFNNIHCEYQEVWVKQT